MIFKVLGEFQKDNKTFICLFFVLFLLLFLLNVSQQNIYSSFFFVFVLLNSSVCCAPSGTFTLLSFCLTKFFSLLRSQCICIIHICHFCDMPVCIYESNEWKTHEFH